jgi:ribosome-associated toxin RatA of RatAB toxin-antitoxin module
MIEIEHQSEIEASPEKVFDLLADHTQFPKWHPFIDEAGLYDEKPIKSGSKGFTKGNFKGRVIENDIVYDRYDRPTYVLGGTTSGNVFAKMSNEFVPIPKGTRVIYRLEVKLKGFMRVLEPFIKSGLSEQVKETLKALNEYVKENK